MQNEVNRRPLPPNDTDMGNPFGSVFIAGCDLVIFDDRPGETQWFIDIAGVLGLGCQVLDRLSSIGDYLKELKRTDSTKPKLMAVDLSWDFLNANFDLLDRGDVPVPKKPHLRGLVMLSEVLTHNPQLVDVPAVMLSSFLSDYDSDYQAGLTKMRARGIRVATLAKGQLRNAGGLERVAKVLTSLGIELPPLNMIEAALSGASEGAMARALGVLANALQVDDGQVWKNWHTEIKAADLTEGQALEFVRLAFKINLAIKTIFSGHAYNQALDDLNKIVPGVVVRDALANAHFRSMTLLAGELEFRVGGAL